MQAFNNTIGIPPNVDSSVRVVQFIAIIIAVVTQDDLMKVRIITITNGKQRVSFYGFSNACISSQQRGWI